MHWAKRRALFLAAITLIAVLVGYSAVSRKPQQRPLRTPADLGFSVTLAKVVRVAPDKVNLYWKISGTEKLGPKDEMRLGECKINGRDAKSCELIYTGCTEHNGRRQYSSSLSVPASVTQLSIQQEIHINRPSQHRELIFRNIGPGDEPISMSSGRYDFTVTHLYMNCFEGAYKHVRSTIGSRIEYTPGDPRKGKIGIAVDTNCPVYVDCTLNTETDKLSPNGEIENGSASGDQQIMFMFPRTVPPPKKFDLALTFQLPPVPKDTAWVCADNVQIRTLAAKPSNGN